MFDNRLTKLREERGLNMKQVAELLEITYTTYVGYEKDKREPESDVLVKIANFYNVSVDYLLGRTDNRQLLDTKETPTIGNADDWSNCVNLLKKLPKSDIGRAEGYILGLLSKSSGEE